MTRSSGFWNLIAKGYAKQGIGNIEAYEHKLARTQSVMRPDMNVLEFGCGTGSTALIHALHVGHMTGIDYASKMVAIARDKIGDVANVSFEQSTLKDWDAPDGHYDMVLGLSILHLVPDHKAAIAKAYRLLKPGGYLATSTICMGDHGGIAPYIVPVATALRIAPVVHMFTAEQLATDIKTAGFDVLESWQPSVKEAVFHLSQKPA